MTESEYETVVEAAPGLRTRIAMRIAGEVGPRIGLIVRIRRSDFYIPDDPDIEIVLLQIREAKDTTEDNSGGERIAWVPLDLYKEVIEYCQQQNINDDEEIFEIGDEQMRNNIKTAGENAAVGGDDDFMYLTPHDLRAYYATNMIRRQGVDPEIVKAMGGWDSDEALKPYLDVALPRDIQNELARRELVEVDVPTPPATAELESIYDELREIRESLKISQVMEDHGLTIEEIKQAKEHVDKVDEGNPAPEATSLDSFKIISGPLSLGILLADSIVDRVKSTLTRSSNDSRGCYKMTHAASYIAVLAVTSIITLATAVSASPLPAPATTVLYGVGLPIVTKDIYWDRFVKSD